MPYLGGSSFTLVMKNHMLVKLKPTARLLQGCLLSLRHLKEEHDPFRAPFTGSRLGLRLTLRLESRTTGRQLSTDGLWDTEGLAQGPVELRWS